MGCAGKDHSGVFTDIEGACAFTVVSVLGTVLDLLTSLFNSRGTD